MLLLACCRLCSLVVNQTERVLQFKALILQTQTRNATDAKQALKASCQKLGAAGSRPALRGKACNNGPFDVKSSESILPEALCSWFAASAAWESLQQRAFRREKL